MSGGVVRVSNQICSTIICVLGSFQMICTILISREEETSSAEMLVVGDRFDAWFISTKLNVPPKLNQMSLEPYRFFCDFHKRVI